MNAHGLSPTRRPDAAAPLAGAAGGTRESVARLLLTAFLVALAADLLSLALGYGTGHTAAKPLLMPLLAGYAAARHAPPLLIAALLFGWGGDVFLLGEADWAFLVGMASFAAGHVCYLLLFRPHARRTPATPALAAGYAAALVVTVAFLWPDLPGELRVPVAGYSLLLTAMAWRASTLGLLAGAGGALFLLSDTLIATGVAEWPQLPAPDLWIMLTYGVAQLMLTVGVLAARRRPQG
ncbi:lysoplasmalogenase [Streptomyces sp. HNM0663]|uniref:Lysoplasmalogenase n=1 Tax=Streptomyces chengmaiensis TaxID=3040919 RepID=A0ABT6HR97_9ACTN|nr:lysoplasmalogenase [Streptomyces chengmaiensis]MDH2390394.1 lysoplasmalogenase [Streptomyces chengmaiensis]